MRERTLAWLCLMLIISGPACEGGAIRAGSTGSGYGPSNGGAASVTGLPTGSTAVVPIFTGSGINGATPLAPGCTPASATECPTATGNCATSAGQHVSVITHGSSCYYADTSTVTPDATLEYIHEAVAGQDYYRFRLTFDPAFVDNTYGDNAIGWGGQTTTTTTTPPPADGGAPGGMMMPGGKMMPMPKAKGGHTFQDLVGSDHAEMLLTDGSGKQVMDFNIDYISVDASRTCGYGNLGVSGGEGKVVAGDAKWILAATSSLDRDLNGCGYCRSDACGGACTISSPATDAAYTPNSATLRWDYRVQYEVWVSAAAFGSAGFGGANITFVHASPSKASSNTVTVLPRNCPPSWSIPYTPTKTCPVSYNVDLDPQGRTACKPTNGGGCPADYTTDVDEAGHPICYPPGTGGGCPAGYTPGRDAAGHTTCTPGSGGGCPAGYTSEPSEFGGIVCVPPSSGIVVVP